MAQLAKIEARNALITANAELTKREQLEIVDYLQKGEAYRNSGDFDLAQDLYEFLRDSMFAKEAHKHHAAKDEVEKAIQACIDSLNKNEKK
jgi:hypothetical protein